MKRGVAVVLDFDGTLIPKSLGSLYDVIDSNGGVTPVNAKRAQEMRRRYLALAHTGKLTKKHQREWFARTIDLYVDSGLTIAKIRFILKNIWLTPGASACLRFLRARDIPVAIVSYGIAEFIDAVLVANEIRDCVDAIYAAQLRVNGFGEVTGFYPRSAIYPFNKGEISRQFADLHRVSYRNLLAVGDSSNGDCELGYLKKHRFGIARDEGERKRLLEVMGAAVVTESFDPATAWLLEKITELNGDVRQCLKSACANPLCGTDGRRCHNCGNALPRPLKIGN